MVFIHDSGQSVVHPPSSAPSFGPHVFLQSVLSTTFTRLDLRTRPESVVHPCEHRSVSAVVREVGDRGPRRSAALGPPGREWSKSCEVWGEDRIVPRAGNRGQGGREVRRRWGLVGHRILFGHHPCRGSWNCRITAEKGGDKRSFKIPGTAIHGGAFQLSRVL